MFLNVLTRDESLLLYRLAHHAVLADGIVTPEESSLLAELQRQLGVGDDAGPQQELSMSEVARGIATIECKRIVLLSLCEFMLIDDVVALSERAWLGELARALGLDDAFLERCLDWMRRKIALQRDAASFIREILPEDPPIVASLELVLES